jgi:hypothetical protein
MKRRHEFYLDEDVSEQLASLARKPGGSKTAIMTTALRAYFDRRGTNELDDQFRARLDKLSLQSARIERDQQIVAESLALLAHFQDERFNAMKDSAAALKLTELAASSARACFSDLRASIGSMPCRARRRALRASSRASARVTS